MTMVQTMSQAPNTRPSKAMIWTGRAMTGLFTAFMLLDIGLKFVNPPVVGESMTALGWRPEMAQAIGALELACVAVYLFPRTAVLGAVLLTGLFGGTMATHLRIDNPLFSHVLFGGYLALLAWGGLYLRDARLRAAFPILK